MDRQQALAEVKKHVGNKNLVKHMLAAEAVMRRLAEHFGEDVEKWGLAGLLHDIDYEATQATMFKDHGEVGARMLEGMGVDPEIIHAVKAHNEALGVERTSLMDKALYAVDNLTGLIVAGALIHPTKKIHSIDVPFLINRFHEKSFARGANREQIASCRELGLSLEEFIGLGLEAMQGIHKELGL